MTFTKETASIAGKKSVETRLRNKEDLWTFVTSGGARRAKEIVEDLLNGVEVTKEERKGVEYLLQFIPYSKGKQGNVDQKGNTIPNNINILNTTTDDLLRIAEGRSDKGTS